MTNDLMTNSASWDDNVLKNNGSFLQSYQWSELQKKLGHDFERLQLDEVVALMLCLKLPMGKDYLYCPRGPVFGVGDMNGLKELLSIIKKKITGQTIFFRIEPQLKKNDDLEKKLMDLGFIKTAQAQPANTRIIDLKNTDENILRQMQHATRYSIKTAEKRGVKIIRAQTVAEKNKLFDGFWKLFKETNQRHKLKSYNENYYREILNLDGACRSEIFAAQYENTVISAALIVCYGKTATYLYSSSIKGFGRLNAPTLVVWEAIREAQRQGYDIFDLWGVSHTNKAWSGLTAFKESFGGQEINYIGTWDYVLDRKWYWAYKTLKQFMS